MTKRKTIAIGVVTLILALLCVAVLRIGGPSDERKLLLAAAAGADRMVVERGDLLGPSQKPRAFVLLGADKVREFVEQLEFTGTRQPCKCLGDWEFKFYQGNELKFMFTYHHGTHLRGLWGGDAYLTERAQTAVPAWLKQREFASAQEIRDGESTAKKK